METILSELDTPFLHFSSSNSDGVPKKKILLDFLNLVSKKFCCLVFVHSMSLTVIFSNKIKNSDFSKF